MAIPTKGKPIYSSDLDSHLVNVETSDDAGRRTVGLTSRSGNSWGVYTYPLDAVYSDDWDLITAEGAKTKLDELSPKVHLHTLSSIGPWYISVDQDNIITFKG